MSELSRSATAEEVYAQIYKESIEKQQSTMVQWKYEDWVNKKIEEAKPRFPSMREASLDKYALWALKHDWQEEEAIKAARYIPDLTEQDFWDAVYNFDPSAPNAPETSRLEEIFISGQLKELTLGKVYGQKTLKLIPYEGALPTTEAPNLQTPFDYAETNGGAVCYPDGHPSLDAGSTDAKKSSSAAKPMKGVPPPVTDADDDFLRRFASLGFVIEEVKMEGCDDSWAKTGHVLVMDMGDKRVRHRNPWFILASKWPTDGEQAEDGGQYYKAKEIVKRDAASEYGVLPGDHNRTPICRIEPMNGLGKRPTITQFGPNFSFNAVRYGGHNEYHRNSQFGPSLVHVMDWYWDPKAQQQVCYTKLGLEYMRYDPEKNIYTYPEFNKMTIKGEHGLFGDLTGRVARDAGGVSLNQRFQNLAVGNTSVHTHHRLVSSSSGF